MKKPKKPQLTQWFSGRAKPARPGLYQREWRVDSIRYSWWDGKFWGQTLSDKDTALKSWVMFSTDQWCRWRGLAQDPGAAS